MGTGISSLAMLIRIKGTWFLCIPVVIKELVFIKPVVSHHSHQGTYLRSGFFWLKVQHGSQRGTVIPGLIWSFTSQYGFVSLLTFSGLLM